MHEVEPDERPEQYEVQPLVPRARGSGVLKNCQITNAKLCVGKGPSGTVLLPESFQEGSGKLLENVDNLPRNLSAQPCHIVFRSVPHSALL